MKQISEIKAELNEDIPFSIVKEAGLEKEFEMVASRLFLLQYGHTDVTFELQTELLKDILESKVDAFLEKSFELTEEDEKQSNFKTVQVVKDTGIRMGAAAIIATVISPLFMFIVVVLLIGEIVAAPGFFKGLAGWILFAFLVEWIATQGKGNNYVEQ